MSKWGHKLIITAEVCESSPGKPIYIPAPPLVTFPLLVTIVYQPNYYMSCSHCRELEGVIVEVDGLERIVLNVSPLFICQ